MTHVNAQPFRPHEIDRHPDGARIEATFAERLGLDDDPDLQEKLRDSEARIEDLEDVNRILRDALQVLLDGAENGAITPALITGARDALAETEEG
jgi:hypothetical protein